MTQRLVKINLLPESHRRPSASSAQQFVRSPLALIIAVLLASSAGFLVMASQMRQRRLSQIQQCIQQIDSKKASIEELSRAVEKLRAQKSMFEGLVQSRSQWARYLNLLSDVTPDGVWFTDLQLDMEKGLILEGSAIGQGGKEMQNIGQLAQELKTNPVFSGAIKDIQIQSIASQQDEETEVIKFTLTGTLSGKSGAP